jgi:tetratricopeptide (TPR) repeat protein
MELTMIPVNIKPGQTNIQSPISLQDLLTNASRNMASKKLVAAESALNQALSIAPESADAQRLAGVVQIMRGNPGKAVEHLRRAVELKPGDFNAHMNLGSALFECSETDAGLTSMRRSCELAPDTAATWYNLGRALHIARYTEEARPMLARAMALDPSHIMVRMTLANVQNSLGEVSEAATLYRDILKTHSRHAKAWFELANLKTIKLDSADALQIRGLLEYPDVSPDDRVWLGYALAKSLEDQNDLEASFNALQTANAVKRRYTPWNIEAEHKRVNSIIETFSRPMAPALDPSLGSEIIFIACLPRSGSTLTEHILASHSMVEGANEIPDLQAIISAESDRRQQLLTQWAPLATAEDWHRLGCEYLARTAYWRRNKPLSTDKNLNSWSLAGPALAMLPGARIVNSRRNPLETCFSCYRQLFSDGASFSYDFESLAHYYAGYERMSRFLKEHFPESYLDFVYEDLVADPDKSIRKLLEFCRLPFESNCLEFHKTSRAVRSTASAAQVRQPLQSNTARSSRYGSLLDPLRNLLYQLNDPAATSRTPV